MLFKSQTLGIFSAARILKWIESWIIVSISMIMNGRDKQTDDRECSLALWADRAVWEHDEIRGKRSRKNLIKPFHSIKYLWHFPSLNFLLLQVFNEKFLSISEQQAEAEAVVMITNMEYSIALNPSPSHSFGWTKRRICLVECRFSCYRYQFSRFIQISMNHAWHFFFVLSGNPSPPPLLQPY